MTTSAQRALTLRLALEAHYGVSLPGAEVMIEQTINAANAWMPTLGTGVLRMCPRSNRPCGLGCDADQCVLHGCRHLRTVQAVVGDQPGFQRVETICLDCNTRIA